MTPELSGQVTRVEWALVPLSWIPLLPLLGAVVNILFGRRFERSGFGRAFRARHAIGSAGVTLVAVGSVALAFVITLLDVAQLVTLAPDRRVLFTHAWRLARIGALDLSFALTMDPLAAVMALVVTFAALLVHAYAAAYMAADPSYPRFFACLNLFVAAMALLVLGDNLVVTFFGWEGVGLASFLLIGFWYRDPEKARAGVKAFVVNRVGDLGFLMGAALLFWSLGGGWVDGRYVERQAPSLAVIAAGAAANPSADQGAITLTTHAGAQVFVDASPADRSLPFAVAPFLRRALPAGEHDLTLVPGDGAADIELRAVVIRPGQEQVITALGPTLTYRALRDQLALRRPADPWITLACLFFFLAAAGKSAQIPLHVWLPDAMAGPTPVSALMHAATLVTAGVYLIARLHFLFALSPLAGGVVALVGAATAFFAATAGLFQYDLKKVLAYSTVSQLGFMFLGLGVGAWGAAIFHLITHAAFKACLFLGAGSVLHGMHAVTHDEKRAQDLRHMGGLRRLMPKTARAYWIACSAIAAAPLPFFAGFWSKDEILWRAFTAQGVAPAGLLYGVGLAASLLTSFYMWRSYYLAFEGPHAEPAIAREVRESPRAMTAVLAVFAALSVTLGAALGLSSHYLGGHGASPLARWLAPVFTENAGEIAQGLGHEYALMALTTSGAIGAWALARRRYGAGRDPAWAEAERRLPGFALLADGYHVDVLYQATLVRGVLRLRTLLDGVDQRIVDGAVNGVAALGRAAARLAEAIDRRVVDGAVNLVSQRTLRAGEQLRRLQTGRVQTYVYGLLGGVVAISLARYFLD